MTKIAILGGSGFVGAHMAIKMIKQGYSVDVYSRRPIINNTYKRHFRNHIFDYTVKEDQLLYKTKYNHIIYCIGNTNYNQRETSLDAFQYTIDHLQTDHLIYMSSSSIYMGKFGLLREDDIGIYNDMNTYSTNKLSEEKVIQKNKKYITTIIRPRAIYGIGDRILLYQLLKKNIFGHMLYIGTTKDNKTSMTHIDTLCDFSSYIIENTSTQGKIYNISDKETYNLYDIFSKMNRGFLGRQPYCIPFSLIEGLSKAGIIDQNTYKGYYDIFGGSKVIDITKSEEIGFISSKNFHEELPVIIDRRKRTIGSIQNMKRHRNNLPWMI